MKLRYLILSDRLKIPLFDLLQLHHRYFHGLAMQFSSRPAIGAPTGDTEYAIKIRLLIRAEL